MSEQVAIIRNVHIGVGDRGSACLWFDTYISEASAALQVISWDDARKLIEAAGVSDVAKLEGRPCYVNVDGNMIRFSKLWQ